MDWREVRITAEKPVRQLLLTLIVAWPKMYAEKMKKKTHEFKKYLEDKINILMVLVVAYEEKGRRINEEVFK